MAGAAREADPVHRTSIESLLLNAAGYVAGLSAASREKKSAAWPPSSSLSSITLLLTAAADGVDSLSPMKLADGACFTGNTVPVGWVTGFVDWADCGADVFDFTATVALDRLCGTRLVRLVTCSGAGRDDNKPLFCYQHKHITAKRDTADKFQCSWLVVLNLKDSWRTTLITSSWFFTVKFLPWRMVLGFVVNFCNIFIRLNLENTKKYNASLHLLAETIAES